METKSELEDFLRHHMEPEGMDIPPLNDQARHVVERRKQPATEKNDVIMRIALFLNRKLRLYQAAVAVLLLCAVYMYSGRKSSSDPGRQRGDDALPALSYLKPSVHSNTVLSSICTSNLNKHPYDGTTRN